MRAWCRQTGRDTPPARAALPAELVADYLAERGAADIPMPGGLSRADWLAQRPALREPFTAQLGWRNGATEPLTVVYGPCPRCGGPTSALPGESPRPCLDCASQAPSDDDDGQAQAEAGVGGERLREYAHRYLEEGLWPVPAWGARPNGECCCPRGADCPRPGKHPRSVHAGPGPRDYSWKPLACRSHAEVDQRFAPGGRYAGGNLMVANPNPANPDPQAITSEPDGVNDTNPAWTPDSDHVGAWQSNPGTVVFERGGRIFTIGGGPLKGRKSPRAVTSTRFVATNADFQPRCSNDKPTPRKREDINLNGGF